MSGNSSAAQKCPRCTKISIIQDVDGQGEFFCSNCGLVITDEHQESSARALQESSIGSDIIVDSGAKDAFGKSINTNQRHFKKLKKLHSRSKVQSSTERNLNQAIQEIDGLKIKLALSDAIIEDAKQMYRKITERRITSGYPNKARIGACIYASCRITQTPKTMDMISKTIDMKKKEVNNLYKRIVNELGLEIPVIDPIKFVPKIANNIGLSEKTQKKAREMIQEVTKTGIVVGKEPIGIVAAALFLSALGTETISQKAISEESGVTRATIENRCRDITKILKL